MDKQIHKNGLGKIAVLMLFASLLVLCLVLVLAQRPRTVSRQGTNASTATTGASTITIKAGGDFQKALNAAKAGDTILLEAGAAFIGPLTLPRKTGDSYVTIQSTAINQLPADQRVSPAQASLMPKIVSPGRGEPALKTAPAAHHYRFVGIEFVPVNSSAFLYDLITLGDGSTTQDVMEKVPHHLVFDRCYIHAYPKQSLKRGIALNSAETSILNSHVSGFKVEGQDSQAIGGWNGPGPFVIENNYLEAAGENIIFGGAPSAIPGLIPSDIRILRNHFFKPVQWRAEDPSFTGVRWTVKNLFELKNARRVKVEGNLFEHNWAHAQVGFAILFTCINDSGSWARIEDVEFTNNIVRGAAGGVNIRGMDDTGCRVSRITIRNNLFEELGNLWGGVGVFLQMLRGTVNTVVDHNTVWHDGHIILADGEAQQGFVFTNNLAKHNLYGVFGSGSSSGNATLKQYFPASQFRRNVILGADATAYPADNFYPSLDLRDPTIKDLLTVSERYKGRGTDGKTIGCDLHLLNSALAGTTSFNK